MPIPIKEPLSCFWDNSTIILPHKHYEVLGIDQAFLVGSHFDVLQVIDNGHVVRLFFVEPIHVPSMVVFEYGSKVRKVEH